LRTTGENARAASRKAAFLERKSFAANEVKLLMEGKPLPEKARNASHSAATGAPQRRPRKVPLPTGELASRSRFYARKKIPLKRHKEH